MCVTCQHKGGPSPTHSCPVKSPQERRVRPHSQLSSCAVRALGARRRAFILSLPLVLASLCCESPAPILGRGLRRRAQL